MIVWGPSSVEETIAGDEVSSRRVTFGSQPEQILFLREMVNEYRGVAAIRARARDIVFRQYNCPPKDQACHALAIAQWVQNNITYVNELPETFQTPTTTVATGYGDCDDFTSLICALCESIGIETELVGMEWDGYFRHIFPRAIIDTDEGEVRMPLDATLSRPVSDLADPITLWLERGHDVQVFVA